MMILFENLFTSAQLCLAVFEQATVSFEFDFHLLEMKLMRDISRHLSQDIMENDKRAREIGISDY